MEAANRCQALFDSLDEGFCIIGFLDGPHDDEQVETGPAGEAPASAEAGTTVLIFDDEPTVRMLIIAALGDCGYSSSRRPTGCGSCRAAPASIS